VNDVYFIVTEALFNVGRHAHASSVRVEMADDPRELRIVVADNGCGFPFLGRYDHAALIAKNIGPATLKERIVSLQGTLTIESTPNGARLEISIPLNGKGV
jgi:signal transduction histidine kinase